MSKFAKTVVFLACLVMGLLLLGGLFVGTGPGPAMAAIPTPVGAQAGGGDWVMVTYSDANFNNADDSLTGASKHAPAYTAADITWTADISGTVYVTCTLGWSNDNTNWATGVTLFGISASATNISQTELFGRYHRVTCIENFGRLGAGLAYTLTVMGKLMN